MGCGGNVAPTGLDCVRLCGATRILSLRDWWLLAAFFNLRMLRKSAGNIFLFRGEMSPLQGLVVFDYAVLPEFYPYGIGGCGVTSSIVNQGSMELHKILTF
jgi:hypothetical protein